jgi:hypothetical protein
MLHISNISATKTTYPTMQTKNIFMSCFRSTRNTATDQTSCKQIQNKSKYQVPVYSVSPREMKDKVLYAADMASDAAFLSALALDEAINAELYYLSNKDDYTPNSCCKNGICRGRLLLDETIQAAQDAYRIFPDHTEINLAASITASADAIKISKEALSHIHFGVESIRKAVNSVNTAEIALLEASKFLHQKASGFTQTVARGRNPF